MDSRELFEVKDDEEQKAKLQDICDILTAAGYFRARLKGLSAFDKVVGGMVWCLEMGAVDIDVNFLFRENLNIGEKLEITEKIVKVLISIKCNYALEPHQIQGLDTVKILPVVQWLVKKAMETREMLSDHLKSVAAHQFQKNFKNELVEPQRVNVTNLRKSFLPQRKFKRKIGYQPESGPKQALCTLMEYDHFKHRQGGIEELGDEVDNLQINERPIEKKLESRVIAQHISSLIHQQADVISQAIKDYALKRTERETERDELSHLQKRKDDLVNRLHKVSAEKNSKEQTLTDRKKLLDELNETEAQLHDKKEKMSHLETERNKQLLKTLDDLAARNEEISSARKDFKNNCKVSLQELQDRNEKLRCGQFEPENLDELKQRLVSAQEQLASVSRILGEKNLVLAKLRRQLDAVPGDSELNQYYRRFTELCAQVNEKQTELNGYYLLYNTLEDTKEYVNKEYNLFASISENFPPSMRNSSSKSEFIQQMENIVTAVHHNKTKIEQQVETLLARRDDLQRSLLEHGAEEQHYRDVLKLVAQESQKYKQLMVQLSSKP